MNRLPNPGGDIGDWGNLLNDFLLVEHNSDGTLKMRTDGTLAAVMHLAGDEGVAGTKAFAVSPLVPTPTLGSQAANKTYVDSVAVAGITDNAVTTSKLADTAVTTPKLATGAVTTAQIANGTILDTNISASAAISKSKLAALNIVDADITAVSQSKVTNLTSDLASKTPNSRAINTGAGLAGGGDLTTDRTLSVVNDSTIQQVEVANNGAVAGARKRINFIAGTNASLSVVDDNTNNKVDVTINAATQSPFDSNGNLFAQRVYGSPQAAYFTGPNGNGYLNAQIASGSNVGVLIATKPGSTGDALEVVNSNNTVVTKIDNSGNLAVPGFALTNSPQAGYVLTADASGNGTWQALPTNSAPQNYVDLITSQTIAGSKTFSNTLTAPIIDNGGQVFNVRAYGAVGNGQRLYGAVASTGSTTVTVAGATFTSNDVGKIAVVYNDTGAGTITTISSVGGATSITLATSAGITTTSTTGYLIYGNDDATAIQATLNAAAAWVQTANTNDPNQPPGSGHVTVLIPATTPNSMFLFASQLSVPSGVELLAPATLVNVLASRNAYCITVQPYAIIRRLELENVFGTGVTCGINAVQAHIVLHDIRVWHSKGSTATPTGLNGATSTTGGTLSANTRYYVVTAIDTQGGETLVSNEISITSTGSTSSNSLNWTAFSGAVSYRIYRGTATGAQNLYFTSNTNSFTDTGGANTSAYPITPGVGLRLLGYHYEINVAFIKIATLGIYHWAGSDCTVNYAYIVGCTTGIRCNATNQLRYSSAFLDTCGGTGSLGGVILDNGCSNISFGSIQAFQITTTSTTLSPVVNIGPLSTTSKNTDIRLHVQANNTGGSGLIIANAQDVTIDQLLSNDTFASGSTTAITTAVVYGTNLAAEISIRSVLSSGITVSSGTAVGVHVYQQSGATTFASPISMQGSQTVKRTAIADTAYTVLSSDYIVSYTSLTAARTVTLETAVGVTGKTHIIKDESGSAGSFALTVAGSGGQTIDGSANKTINTANGSLRIYSNGANWFTF